MTIEVTKQVNDFNQLCHNYLASKEQEKVLTEARIQEGQKLLEFETVKEQAKERGAVTFRSDKFEAVITYIAKDEYDLQQVASVLTAEEFRRIFPPKPEFSKTGLNALLQELNSKALTNKTAANRVNKITEALEQFKTTKQGSTQIKVTER